MPCKHGPHVQFTLLSIKTVTSLTATSQDAHASHAGSGVHGSGRRYALATCCSACVVSLSRLLTWVGGSIVISMGYSDTSLPEEARPVASAVCSHHPNLEDESLTCSTIATVGFTGLVTTSSIPPGTALLAVGAHYVADAWSTCKHCC